MAGNFTVLYQASFTNQTSFTITHNLDLLQIGVLVRIGNLSRNDLIQSISPDPSNPRRGTIVTLISQQSGQVLFVDTDFIFEAIPTPENTAVLSGGTAMTESLVDAKGDLLAGTSNDTLTRLPVGTDTHVLTADSSEASGIKWAAGAAGASAVYVDYYDVGTSSVETSNTVLGLDTSRQSNALFVLASDVVTVQSTGAGNYAIRYEVTFGDTDNSNRTAECWLELNAAITPLGANLVAYWDTSSTSSQGGVWPVSFVSGMSVGTSQGRFLDAWLSSSTSSRADLTTTTTNSATWTISAWAFNLGASGYRALSTNGQTGANSAYHFIINSGTNEVGVWSNNGFYGSGTTLSPAAYAGWHHYASTFDGTTVRFYVDGVAAGTATPVWAGVTGVDTIGGSSFGEGFSDRVCDFGVWGRQLSAVEIADVYTEGNAGNSLGSIVGGLGWTEVPATRSVFSHWDEHGLNTNNTAGRSVILSLVDSQQIRIRGIASVAGYTTAAGGVSLQIMSIGANGAAGATGAQGPTGSGSSITVQDDGSTVSGGPHSTLNFIGNLLATDTGGSVAAISSIFGADFQQATNVARSTTTSATYITRTTLTTPTLTGTYIVWWMAVVDASATNRRVNVKLEDITAGATVGVEQIMEPKDPRNRNYAGAMFTIVLAAASNQWDIMYKVEGGVGTAGIAQATIMVWRIA